MKDGRKIFVNAMLLFAIVGFVSYLFIIITSFFGCCAGITKFFYQEVTLVILLVGLIVFAFCMYNNCYKTRKSS
jgi:hypothetical protein